MGLQSTNRVIEMEDGNDLEVDFYGHVEWVDHGIGSYEFWGSRGYDRDICAECGTIEWDKTIYSDEQNKEIKRHLDLFFEEIAIEIENNN